jgi:N-methylhydantoinase A/oxoprolinase/acetone carboxylase beta subunit
VKEGLRERALRDMRGEGFPPDAVEIELDDVPQREGDALVRLTATARLDHYAFAKVALRNGGSPAARAETRLVHWPGAGVAETAVVDFAAMAARATVEGPAVIEAGDTTYAVPPGWTYRVDEYGTGRLSAR